MATAEPLSQKIAACEVFAITSELATVDSNDTTHSIYTFTDSTSIAYTASGSLSLSEINSGDGWGGEMRLSPIITVVEPSVIELNTAVPALYDTTSHVLPPTRLLADPSLNVLNLAKVGSLQIGSVLPIPTKLVGVAGDREGMVRVESGKGIWYCNADYDGKTEIWELAPFTGSIPSPVSTTPIGYHQIYRLVGSPSDKIGEIRMLGNVAFICTGVYNGMTPIWKQITHGSFDSLKFSTTYDYQWTSTTNTVKYPTGYKLTGLQPIITTTNNRPYNSTTMSIWTANGRGAVYVMSPTYSLYPLMFQDTASTIGSGFWCTIINTSTTYTIELKPLNGSGNTIDGLSTLVIPPKTSVDVYCSGSTFYTAARVRNRSMVTLTPGTTVAVNAALGTFFSLTMAGNYTLSNPTNLQDGDVLNFNIYQSGSTARTLSFGTMYKWAGGTVPTVSVGTGKIDMIRATYDALTSRLYCEMIKDIR